MGAAALPIENYHLDALHVPKKRRMGGVPHKSPGPKALVSSGSDTQRRMSLNLAMDDMFDSFLGQIGDGKLGLQDSNQLPQIESFSTEPTVFSTGNAPKNLHVHNCYMAEALEPEPEPINKKRDE